MPDQDGADKTFQPAWQCAESKSSKGIQGIGKNR